MSDDLNPETRRLVDLARQARTPGEGDKLRIAERLAVPLAAGIATGTAAVTAKAGGFGLAAKLATIVALGAVGAAVVVTQTSSTPEPVAAVPSPTPALAPSSAPPEPVVTLDQLPPAEPAPAPRAVAPSSPSSTKPEGTLAEEAALLHQAQAAWRAGQSARALALANQHAQRFPRSQLGNERDVLRVLSMCKLGQVQSAKQVGARLLKKAKGSPWYQSVAASCAAE